MNKIKKNNIIVLFFLISFFGQCIVNAAGLAKAKIRSGKAKMSSSSVNLSKLKKTNIETEKKLPITENSKSILEKNKINIISSDYKKIIKQQVNKAIAQSCIKKITAIKKNIDTSDGQKSVNINNLIIRVLLDEKETSKAQWSLSAPNGFVIYFTDTKTTRVIPSNLLNIKIVRNKISLNGEKQSSNSIVIKPFKDFITYNKHLYKGFFNVVKETNSVFLINHVDLEDYVESVLPYEGFPGWPDEFNKAFCLVVRTYALTKVTDERAARARTNKPALFDIRNTNIHQVYRGYRYYPHIKKLVDETKNLILTYNKKPILAMFDICCGGVLPCDIKDFNFTKAPYLARNHPCHYCKACRSCQWKVTYNMQELEKIFKSEIPELSNIARFRDIKVSEKDKAGIVLQVKIKGRYSWRTITGKKVKSMLKKLKSKCFDIEKNGQDVIFSGKGYGHLLGLCQWGAYIMVVEGWNYKNILKFYYPGCEFTKLKVNWNAKL